MSRTRRRPDATGQPSARVRADLLEFAAVQLLPSGVAPDVLDGVLDRLLTAFGAQGALVLAPGSLRPHGQEAVRPADLLDDLVLLAQVRAAWASHGPEATATGRPFEVELDSGRHRARLLVAPAEPAGRQASCAVALMGDVSRWKAPGRATLRALATILAAAQPPSPAPAARTAGGAGTASAAGRAASATRRPPVPPARPSADPAATDPASPAATDPGAPASTAPPARGGHPAIRHVRHIGRAADRSSPAGDDSLAAALVAGAPAAIVAVDADRRIREFNPAAEELFGRTRAATLGLDMPHTLVPERFRQQFIDAMAGYLATGDRSGFTRRIKLRALRSDGTERSVELTPTPVTVGDKTYFFGFLRDATELENATMAVTEGEARFRLLSALAPVGIVQSDVEGTCRFVNDKWTEMTGIPASEVIGRNWRTTINPADVLRIDAMRDEAGPDATELATDCRLRTAAGGEHWVHVVVRRVVDQQGSLVGRVAALTDVDARKAMEAAGERDRQVLAEQNVELRGLNAAGEQDRRRLAEQNDELRDLSATRLRYLATVSHELRTPLTSIVSFCELIRSESPGLAPDSGEYLDIVQRNAERLLRVVSDLVDLQGLEEGIARLELSQVSVPQVARDSVRSGWATAAVDGVSLDVYAQDGPDVRADGSRLQQVLDNLISNAVKFSASGGRVEVRATHDGSEWRIDVADDGMGIPEDELGRLFDRFFRASNARDGGVPGTGLGLPAAKAITELHGGRIEVASTAGSGTTFSVYLPIGS